MTTILPIHVEGCNFVDSRGVRRIICGFDAFRLLEHFHAGRDIGIVYRAYQAVLGQLQGIIDRTGDGAWLWPCLRLFTMYQVDEQGHGIGIYRPQDNPEHYTNLRALCDESARWGFGSIVNVFADRQRAMPDLHQSQDHFAATVDILTGCGTAILVLGNEGPAVNTSMSAGSKNGWRLADYPRPMGRGFIACAGSNMGDEVPPTPGWDCSVVHGRRDGWAKMLKNPADRLENMEDGLHHPVFDEEDIGFADEAIPGRRSNLPAVAYTLAHFAAAGARGMVLHNEWGMSDFSQPMSPRIFECGQAFVAGLSKFHPVQHLDV